MGEAIPDSTWEDAVQRVNGTTSCACLSLIQFKILHRSHYSNASLANMFGKVDENCYRCHSAPGALTQIFWSCPSLNLFWFGAFKIISEVTGIDYQPNMYTSIFGTMSLDSMGRFKDIMAFSTLIARRQIILHWKSSCSPKLFVWMTDLMLDLKLERI